MMAPGCAVESQVVAASEETLVLGTLRGDRSAFAELYDRRARLIRAICYDVTHDSHVASDLTQDVFLRAYRKLGDLANPARFTPWLVSIARRVCLEWRRRRIRDRQRFGRSIEDLEIVEPPGAPNDQVLDLREAIAKLPEKDRLVLHAFYLQELDAEQARTVLGLSRSGLYRALANARRRIAAILHKQEMPS
jgi:RNA polymerase sigma-70 factor (ECF subfamily)